MKERQEQPADLAMLIRRHRRAARLSQEELAARATVGVRTISDIERGANLSPHRETVRLIADALQLGQTARAALEAATVRRLAEDAARPAAGAVQGPSLVGRQEEVRLLERHLAGDGPPVLLFAGEPGSGKSRLLAEAAGRADELGWRVVIGGCQRSAGQEPYAPLPGAIKSYLRRRPVARLRADLNGCAWLVRLLPELAEAPIEPLAAWSLAPAQERRLIAEAVARFLDTAAGTSGVLLALDDLQWAGSDCLELLALVLRTTDARRVRVLGAYRDTELLPGSPLDAALADLAGTGLGRQRTLAPLSHDAAASLLRTVLSEEGGSGQWDDSAIVAQALQRAGGVPFVLVSYARALQLRPESTARAAEPLQVPWDVAQSVRQRLAALPEGARTVLQTAAVIGREVPPEVLLAATTLAEDAVLDALEAANRARLLVDEGNFYRFAHDVIREVIDADLGSARRRTTHRLVAEALDATGSGSHREQFAALAYHYSQGEQWERALEYLVKAADTAASASAAREALTAYGEALTACRHLRLEADAAALGVLEKRAWLRHGLGDFPGAAADFAAQRELAAATGNRHAEALALVYRGTTLFFAHQFVASEESFRAALELAGDQFEDVRFHAIVELAHLLVVIDRQAEAEALLAVAIEMLPRIDDPLGRGRLANVSTYTRVWRGEFGGALEWLARWRAEVTASADLSDRLFMQWCEGLLQAGRGEYGYALKVLDELLATCLELGEMFVYSRAVNTAGWIHGELYDFEQAMALNRESLEAAGSAGFAGVEIANNARLNLGDSLLALGRLEEAEIHFATVETTVRDPKPEEVWVLWRYAQHLFHSFGELWLRRGELATAARYADECLQAAQRSGSKKNIVKARRLRGQVLLAGGQIDEAAPEIEAALSVAHEVGNPPQLWQTYAAMGELRAAQVRQGAADAAYWEAVEVIERTAATLPDGHLRTTFLQSAAVQALRSYCCA